MMRNIDENEHMTVGSVHSSTARERSIKGVEDIARSAVLNADRNRWFFFSCFLIAILFFLVIEHSDLSKRLATNYKVAWVKMYSNGTWEVDISDNKGSESYLRNTVNHILSEWVTRRYSKKSETIRSDYGYAHLFMSSRLKTQFKDEDSFNAAQVAADIRVNTEFGEVKYEVGAIDHFDVAKDATFGNIDGETFRSNIFSTRYEYLVTGDQKTPPLEIIIRVEWRLLSEDEVTQRLSEDGGVEWLRTNPIGLEIISYSELESSANIDKMKGVK